MKLAVLLIALAAMTTVSEAEVKKQPFGKAPDGNPVDIYTLTDGQIEARIMTYGGIVVSLKAPDRNGKVADIVLGHDNVDGYTQGGNKPFFGALVGRYANRIAHGTFTLEGKKYNLPKNDGDNTLHGGTKGFDKYLWTAKEIPNGVEVSLVSKDGDQGFPGTLKATVQYTLKNHTLQVEYHATTDKPTVLNLSQHSYFNLAGHNSGTILNHVMQINASRYTPVDETLIPTGELASVQGTPFDFRQPTPIGQRINDKNEQLKRGKGYDHNWVTDGAGMRKIVTVYEPTSGRVLEVETDQPGLQFYTGNFLDGTETAKGGGKYPYRGGFCVETQHFPDSPNHPNFPSTELKPGQTFHTVTRFVFSSRK